MATTTNRPARPTSKPQTTEPAATPTESAASVASRVAPLDLASLSATKVTRPKKTINRESKGERDNTVAENWIRELESERGDQVFSPDARALTVPVSQLGELRSRLNQAGAKLKAGVGQSLQDGRKIPALLKAYKDATGDAKNKLGAEKVTLLYWTQKRKEVKRNSASTVQQAVTGQAPASN